MDIRLATVEEVADLLKLHSKTVYRLIKRDGFPPPLKLGGASRWDLAAVQAWIHTRSKA